MFYLQFCGGLLKKTLLGRSTHYLGHCTYFSSKYFEETLLPKSAIMFTPASLRKLDTVLSPINPLPNYAYLIFVLILKNYGTKHSYYQIPIIMNCLVLSSNSVWLKAKISNIFNQSYSQILNDHTYEIFCEDKVVEYLR